MTSTRRSWWHNVVSGADNFMGGYMTMCRNFDCLVNIKERPVDGMRSEITLHVVVRLDEFGFPVDEPSFMVENSIDVRVNVELEVLHAVVMVRDVAANDLLNMAHSFHLLEE